MNDARVLVVTITYGHSATDVEQALRSARELCGSGSPVELLVLDDCSPNPTAVDWAASETTPSNRGYAAALNYLFDRHSDQYVRIVLVNPDATIDAAALRQICWPAIECAVAVPSILSRNGLENVREILSPGMVARQLVLARLGRQRELEASSSDRSLPIGLPWVPAGTVASFDTQIVKRNPFLPEMFWLEMSAWAREFPSADPPMTMLVLADQATHTGASTKEHASAIVEASLIVARTSYVKKYGSSTMKAVLPACVMIGLGMKAVARRTSLGVTRSLWRVYRGRVSWQEVAR